MSGYCQCAERGAMSCVCGKPSLADYEADSATHRLKCRVIELEAVLREALEWFGGGEVPAEHEGDRIRARMKSTLTKGKT